MVSVLNLLTLPDIRNLLMLTVFILIAGTIVFHGLEGWDYIDSFYFSVITLTTIGYGDLHPTTPLSKLCVVVFVFLGLGIILGFISALSKHGTSAPKKVAVENDGGWLI
jgi:voltage-gated potassium channel